ncbi:MAG: hypothetical protein ACM3NQ_04465 [Bacteroidales bacterium]
MHTSKGARARTVSPDVSIARGHRWVLPLIAAGTLLVGCWAAWVYHDAGLTLSHYDTKGHLVVARRVIDSLTPGWRQFGALWLPLPHLLNLLPVQVDAWYRSGASAVALSVISFVVAAVAVGRLVLSVTGSPVAACFGAAVLALNPDLLYLQSTPMTEALLIALMVVSLSLTLDWLREQSGRNRRLAGSALAALCLTRYEAWPFTAALLLLAFAGLWRHTSTARESARRVAALALYPGVALGLFFLQNRVNVGEWFVASGFFVPDNVDTGNPITAVGSIWWGTHKVVGTPLLAAGMVGVAAYTVRSLRDRDRARLLPLLALFAVGALPAYAFYSGHPFRIRYMTPLVPAIAIYAAAALALLRGHLRQVAAVGMVCAVVLTNNPFALRAPMLLEAQWDSGNAAARRVVTRYLATHYDGRTILASMASLAHFMQESSVAGIQLKDYLHEGNGDLWEAALANPRPHVGWIVMEEWAEGGDRLAKLARENPDFLRGYRRVAEGGGVALYRATPAVVSSP